MLRTCTVQYFYQLSACELVLADKGRADRVGAAGGVPDGVRDHVAGDPVRGPEQSRVRHAGRDDRARLLAHVRRVQHGRVGPG